MNLTPLFTQIFGAIWYLTPFAILAMILKTPWFKGVMGEFIVNLTAKLFLDKQKYHLIKNVTLPTEDGTTQIDHIIVSKYGVFVVETKNMKGWIFGNAHQKTWTQKIYKHSSKFQNPLHQNYKHVKTLESLLELNDQQMHSVVVFVGDSTFKTDMPENVTYGGGYIRYIKSKTQRVLTDVQVTEITKKITAGRLTPSFKTNREHVKHIKTIVAEKEKTDVQTCPACQSPMMMRETKKGQNIGNKFWGCSKFSKM
ncbi:MAG: NERD domain-containing protein [Candidatus Saccharibacteria bacterium]|nr:NERD domain-containing protein [Moraxellaceae bacterium]